MYSTAMKWFSKTIQLGFTLADVEALPDDMQRDISQMRELDMLYQGKNLCACTAFNNYYEMAYC